MVNNRSYLISTNRAHANNEHLMAHTAEERHTPSTLPDRLPQPIRQNLESYKLYFMALNIYRIAYLECQQHYSLLTVSKQYKV